MFAFDDESLHTVNVSKVAKNVLSIGQFGLFQIEGENIIATHWFMLNVSDEQFWKIQCKLEAKQKNCWLFKGKDGIQPYTGASLEETYELYCSLINDRAEEIKRTSLTMGGMEILTDNTQYIGIPLKYLDMIDYPPTIRKATGRGNVVVDDIHVFTIASQESTECKYLKPLR